MNADALMFIVLLSLWSAIAAYTVRFKWLAGAFKKKMKKAPAGHGVTHAAPAAHGASTAPVTKANPRRAYSSHEGFSSYRKGEHLTVEDIVQSLASQKESR